MKIPIRYNPLGNDHDETSGGAVYPSKGCFLFRDSTCVQSNMSMTSKTIATGTGRINRLEMYDSATCVSANVLGGTMYVYGGTATATEVFAGGKLLVASGGVADGVNIPSAASVTAGQGGTISNAYLYQASARLSGWQGTIADTTLGVARCSILATSCYVDGATLKGSTYVAVSQGTAVNLTLTEPSASMAANGAYIGNMAISKGSGYLDKCSASGIMLGDGAILAYASQCHIEGLDMQSGARLSVTLNDAYDVHIEGSCPYGSMLVTNGSVSGGMYQQLTASNNAQISNVHVYVGGTVNLQNKVVVDGLAFHGSGTASNFFVQAYTTVGGIVLADNGCRLYGSAMARSTMSNVRFSNATGTAYFSCLGDGEFNDISAGSNGYVYASLGNGGTLASITAVSAGLTVGLYGVMENVDVERGGILVSRYGTASHVHVSSGTIDATEAVLDDVEVMASGSLVLNSCAVSGVLSGHGNDTKLFMSSGCTISNATITGWGSATYAYAVGGTIGMDSGYHNVTTATLTSVTVSSGATVSNFGGSHGMITIEDGGIYVVTSSADASNVHVKSGGSLNCINNAHVWACTSDTGAIVTGSNIEII